VSMHVIWTPEYEVDIGPHVFPTLKYRLVKERLIAEGTLAEADFVRPRPADHADLARVHTGEYLRKIRDDDLSPAERLRLEVPFSPQLREAMVLCCGGSIECGRRALADGLCVHLGGGFHHAFATHGEGFCLLNDVAVAALAKGAGLAGIPLAARAAAGAERRGRRGSSKGSLPASPCRRPSFRHPSPPAFRRTERGVPAPARCATGRRSSGWRAGIP